MLLVLDAAGLGFVDPGLMRVEYIEAEYRIQDIALFCCMIAGMLSNIHFDRRLELKKFIQC